LLLLDHSLVYSEYLAAASLPKVKMRIACLQFAPLVGDAENNINLANSILDKADPKDLDLLVLPEMAFSGEYPNMNPPLPTSYNAWTPDMPLTFSLHKY
jgi:hypothetical protein